MRVLELTRYGPLGASSRVRSFQYLPAFAEAGLQVTVAPLFSDAYVAGLQQGKKLRGEIVRAYFGRIKALLGSRSFDLLWIEKECLPWVPVGFERWLLPKGIPYVLDYDDAVFHQYDLHRKPMVRRLLAGKHPALMRGAAMVVAGNDYLAGVATAAGAAQVTVVPTVIDLNRYAVPGPSSPLPAPQPPTIGWIGQRSTAAFLQPLTHVFQDLLNLQLASFTAVGIDSSVGHLPMRFVPWTEATEVNSIQQFDIGIMPLPDQPFEQGKCGYKLIQYMACGLPVVASPVGANRQIVEHGVNGFLAETPAQWKDALHTLLGDRSLRVRMGAAGRRKVEQQFCLQVTAPRLVAELRRCARSSQTPS